jgi:hypothetical protein
MIPLVKNVSLLIACSALVLTFWISQDYVLSMTFLIVFVINLIADKKYSSFLSSILFIVVICGAAFGITIGGAPSLLLLVCVASIFYWDLDALDKRLKPQKYTELTRAMERSHIYRLLGSLGIGYLIGLVSLSIDIRLSLGWAILLGVVVFAGIFLIIRSMRLPAETL